MSASTWSQATSAAGTSSSGTENRTVKVGSPAMNACSATSSAGLRELPAQPLDQLGEPPRRRVRLHGGELRLAADRLVVVPAPDVHRRVERSHLQLHATEHTIPTRPAPVGSGLRAGEQALDGRIG